MLAAASHDTALGRHYWTLAAHPGRFRITDAVRDLDEDWWTIGRSGLHAGDRFAVWKYKGSDAHRGIVAFGEILTEPAIREDDPEYWNDPDAPAAAMRVLVRYVIKPEPLWHELAPHDSVIRDLPVSRSQGGTVHHVSPDQWTQLMALVGGWPEPDNAEDSRDWPLGEIKQAVAAYFTMLRAELAGETYAEAGFSGEVQAATGRSRRAVEATFKNISAVLRDIGVPYVAGYQPYPRLQAALRTEVELFLASDPDTHRLLEHAPAPALPPAAQLVEVAPPVMSRPGASGRPRVTAGVDYMERQARNQDIGLKGEHLVVEYERAWLSAHGRPDLAGQVAHVPSTLGDGTGYDVSSFLPDGSPHHIEVKATCGSINAPFYLSAGELAYAREHPAVYSIYRVFDLGPDPRFYKLAGDMEQILDLKPVSFQARVKAPGPRPDEVPASAPRQIGSTGAGLAGKRYTDAVAELACPALAKLGYGAVRHYGHSRRINLPSDLPVASRSEVRLMAGRNYTRLALVALAPSGNRDESEAVLELLLQRYASTLEARLPAGTEVRWHARITGDVIDFASLTLANCGYLGGQAESAADWTAACCTAWLDALRAMPLTDAELAAAAASARKASRT